MPLVPIGSVGKNQLQQAECHGKGTAKLPLGTVPGLAQPALYGANAAMLAIGAHHQGDRVPGCRSHEAGEGAFLPHIRLTGDTPTQRLLTPQSARQET